MKSTAMSHLEDTTSPQYLQSKRLKHEDVVMSTVTGGSPTTSGTTIPIIPSRAIPVRNLSPDADGVLLWLARYAVERNHPRDATGTMRVWKSAGEVVSVSCDEKISRVFQKLITEGFLGAPVLDIYHRYMGFVDMLDLVYYICNMFHAWERGDADSILQKGAPESSTDSNSQASEEPRKHVPGPGIQAGWATFVNRKQFLDARVQDVITSTSAHTMSRTGVGHVAYRGFSSLHSIETMARTGAHRIPILGRDGKVKGIITQSMVISLFDQNMRRFGALAALTVSDMLAIIKDEVLKVKHTTITLDAFRVLVEKNCSGLAVVNENGELTDTLSVRDLRSIGTRIEHFERLFKPIHQFKLEARTEFPEQTPTIPVFVTLTDTLETVIHKMDDGNLHRVFVCQSAPETNKLVPTHVITQRDVLRFILYSCGLEPTIVEENI